MWKDLLELCETKNIDVEKAYVAYLVDTQIGRDDFDYEKVCEETYKQFVIDLTGDIFGDVQA